MSKNNSKVLYVSAAFGFGVLTLLFSVIVISQIRSSNAGGDVTLPEEGGRFGGLAPTERPPVTEIPAATSTGETTGGSAPTLPFESPVLPALRQLSSNPVAGATFYTEGDELKIRYMERGNAHIFDTYPRLAEWERVSRMTIPKVYESWWYGNGSSTILRLLDEETGVTENFAARVVRRPGELTGDGDYLLSGRFLDRGIRSLTHLQENGNAVAYLTPGTLSSIHTLSQGATTATRRYQIPGNEWQLQWPSADEFFVTTNASAFLDGHLLVFEEDEEEPRLLLSGVGLTTNVSPDGAYVLYTTSADRGFAFRVYNRSSGVSTDLPVRTLPEKCVWTKEAMPAIYCAVPSLIYNGDYPDIWYQGQVHFYDTIFRINITTGTVVNVADYRVLQRPMDIINPTLSPDGSYLLLTNKIDGKLWGLDLETL